MRMLAMAIAASCMLAGCAAPRIPLAPRHPPLAHHRTEVGVWRLDISHNRFSEEIVCRLGAKDKRSHFQAGAVAFRFPRSWNVHEAVYRVDGGAPRFSRDDIPELLRGGAPIDRGGVTNSSEGLVWVPFRLLRSANSIAIQARPDRAARTFHFRGLNGLYATAVARGCAPNSRFGS